MNMISTGTFQTEMDASGKHDNLVSKLVSAWEKKNAKVARAGGVSLMALSLAACGSSDDTSTTTETTTTTDTTTTTPVVTTPTAENKTLGTGVDTIATGAGDDVINAGLDGANQTLGALDTIDGGAGSDTVNIALAASITPKSITNVETVNVTSAATTTLNMINSSGYTSISNTGTTDTITVSNINSAGVDLTVENTANDQVFSWTASALTGTADTVDLTVAQVTGGAKVTLTGAIETLNLTSSGSANNTRIDSDATTLNITGDQDVTITAASTLMDLTSTIDASAATGKVTLTHDHTTAAQAVTITGGSGKDSFTLTGTNNANDVVKSGAGDDTITFTANLDDLDTIDGGSGTDTLAGTTAELKALTVKNLVSNVEALSVTNAHTGVLKTATVGSSIDAVKLAAGSNNGTVTFGEGDATLTLGTSNASHVTVNDTGNGVSDTLTINSLKSDDSMNNKNLTINGFETVIFDTSNAAGDETVAATNVTGDADATGVRTPVTLTLQGAGDFTTSGATTLGAATGTGVIDASALTGALVMGAAAVGVRTITGGSGADTLLGDNQASTLTGGAGKDAITGGTKADTIDGGAGDDTLNGSAASATNFDTVSGGAGADTFKYTDAQLVSGVTLDGGDGTDILSIQDLSAIDDADMTGVSNIETITSAATGLSATLGAEAAAGGIATVTLAGTAAGGVADSVTVDKKFSSSTLSVTLDALDDGGSGDDSNTVDASAYTGAVTFTAKVATAITGAAGNAAANETAITGGTGTGDVLQTVGGTFTAAHLTGVKAIETFKTTDDATASFTLHDNNAADGKTLTVDGRSIVNPANTFAVNASADTDGIITVHGSSGVDTITGSASDNGDTLHGHAGGDNFVFAAANLTKLDTVDGGAGKDTVKIAAGTTVDADFTNISNIEVVESTGATTMTLAAEYVGSGSSAVTLSANTNTLNMDKVTTAQTLTMVAGTDTVDASDMTAALTVKVGEDSITNGDTITAGAGTADKMIVTFDGNNLDALAAADLANVTGIEIIESATDAAASIETADANTAATASLTIDMSKNASAAAIIDVSSETDAALTIVGGGGTNTVTLSASAIGDTYTGGAGADNLTVAVDQITSADTLNGVSGTDKITLSSVGTLADGDLTNVSNFDTLVLADGTNTIVLGSEYAGAGFSAVTTTGTGNDSITLGTGVTTKQTITLLTGDDTVSAIGATGDMTITIAEDALDGNDTITGGSGTDTLTITYDTDGAGTDTITAAEMAKVSKIDTIKFASNIEVDSLALNNANIAKGGTMTIDATLVTSAAATIDGSAELDGSITYKGGGGIDTVTGTAGADTISGNAGADVITGGKGGDTITGGDGADVFTYTAANQSTGTTQDSISDYVQGTDKFAVTIDNSTASGALVVDATVQTAQAGTAAIQSNMSGSIGQAFYDTTNSDLVVNMNADNLVTTLDLQIGVNAAATAANTIKAGDINFTIKTGSGADTIVTGAGVDTIESGGGTDIINSGSGADTITLSVDSADDVVRFESNEIGTATAANGSIDVDTINNFLVGAGNDQIEISVTGIEGMTGVTDLVLAGKGDVSITAATTSVVTDGGTNATDLGTAATTSVIVAQNAADLNEATVEALFDNGGGGVLTFNEAFAVGDAFLAAVDNGTDTAIYVMVVGGNGIANDETAADGELTAVKLTTLAGVDAAQNLHADNFDFIA